MTTPDSSTQPPSQPPSQPQLQPPRRARRIVRWLAVAVGVFLAIVVLAAALLYGALTTQRGTALAWRTAVAVLGGRLAGTLEGGTIATGLRMRDVSWHGANGMTLAVDSLSGQWAFTWRPRRFVVAYLHAGNIDARIVPSNAPSHPLTLPADLRVPIALDIQDVRVAKLTLHQGTSTSAYSHFVFHARSDGRHHEAAVEQLQTPYGAVSAHLKLDGVRPFPLAGDFGYAGRVSGEDVQMDGRLGGSLERLLADLDASGMKLMGHAHVEATPFADVPLQRATLAFDHVNPQAFAAGAPAADLSLRADLQPVPAVHAPFTVAGPVSIVNMKPGLLDAHLLPLVDARADVILDAHTQRVSNLAVRLVKGATVTGGGQIAGRNGRFDLRIAGLDLNVLNARLRQTQLSGPVTVGLAGDVRTVALDLADPRAALRAQGKVTSDAKQTAFDDLRVTSGAGRLDVSGALQRDAHSSYALKATLTDFDPLSLTVQTPPGVPARGSANTRAKATAQAKAQPTAKATAKATATPAASATAARPASPAHRIAARVNGTLDARGTLAATFTTRATFRLGPSVYDDFPLTGQGVVQLAGSRLLPSTVNLSVAGNTVAAQGSFGAPGDRLRFNIDAPQLDNLGFGVAGQVAANGDLSGSFAHPNVALDYKADRVVFGGTHVGHAQGHAEMRDGANGALGFNTDARDIAVAGIDLATLEARLTGTRAHHTLTAAARGTVRGQALDFEAAANGGLADTPRGERWTGTITQLRNRGTPSIELGAPLAVSAGAGAATLGPTHLTVEGAVLALKSFDYDRGQIRSAGSLTDVSVARLLQLQQQFTGTPPALRTDLVFDGDWNFSMGQNATGYVQIQRRSGDVTTAIGSGLASLGIADIHARAAFGPGNRVNLIAHAQAARVGTLDVNAYTALTARDGVLTLASDAPIGGTVKANVPSLKTTGGLLGPSYLLDGHLALQLALAGTLERPDVSGALTGDGLSATLVDQGAQLKDGVVRVLLSHNLVDFQQVEFHGGKGTLRATGQVRIDNDQPDMRASLVADKLELFASPDRQLSLTGSASIANAGSVGGLQIDGKFTVDHALFDMPESAAPSLGDDVVIVRPDGTTQGGQPSLEAQQAQANRPAPRFAPHANVAIDLGSDFRFRGRGADLGLAGTITATSEPGVPLRAVGNVRVTEGSTYTAFGRKLTIEDGYFTFNGPVTNPGINILAMRRNQQVEAGVQVTGTLAAPVAKLVSEPTVPDNEKLSWLLFGHGTDQGNNLGQQNAMTTALALLGSASGRRIAQSVGLDEFSIGRSEVGLTDPQVVMISKVINERLVIGYEQGLQSAANAIKATINLTRYWSLSVYSGTFTGADINYARRFNKIGWW